MGTSCMSWMNKSACVVFAVVFWQLFLLTVTLWFWWLCQKSLTDGWWQHLRSDRLLDASVYTNGLTRLNSIADAVNCFGYCASIFTWAHVWQSNETLMGRHSAYIISGRLMGWLPMDAWVAQSKWPYTQMTVSLNNYRALCPTLELFTPRTINNTIKF